MSKIEYARTDQAKAIANILNIEYNIDEGHEEITKKIKAWRREEARGAESLFHLFVKRVGYKDPGTSRPWDERIEGLLKAIEDLKANSAKEERERILTLLRGSVASLLGEKEQAEASLRDAVGKLEDATTFLAIIEGKLDSDRNSIAMIESLE